MRTRLYHYLAQVIRGKKKGVTASCIQAFFWVLSWPYRFVIFFRNWGYDHDWLRQYQPPIPVVISVGNLVAGGVGKTPVTQLIAGRFLEEHKIAILSRGYRSHAEKGGAPVILSSGKGPAHSAAYAGDEPYLLSANLPKAWVFVGKDRIRSANVAAKEGIELVILDDGMQHRKIARDYEVVVIDGEDPFGQEHFLPRGLLRESPKELKRADLVIINHLNNQVVYEQVKNRLREFTLAPVIGIRYKWSKIAGLLDEELPSLEGKTVAIFCGIAQPEHFQNLVSEMGAKIAACRFFPDHHALARDELLTMANEWKALGVEAMVCTEKDKVKLPEGISPSIPLFWIKIEPQVVEEEIVFENFINQVKKSMISII